jgi:hypothetical protein
MGNEVRIRGRVAVQFRPSFATGVKSRTVMLALLFLAWVFLALPISHSKSMLLSSPPIPGIPSVSKTWNKTKLPDHQLIEFNS